MAMTLEMMCEKVAELVVSGSMKSVCKCHPKQPWAEVNIDFTGAPKGAFPTDLVKPFVESLGSCVWQVHPEDQNDSWRVVLSCKTPRPPLNILYNGDAFVSYSTEGDVKEWLPGFLKTANLDGRVFYDKDNTGILIANGTGRRLNLLCKAGVLAELSKLRAFADKYNEHPLVIPARAGGISEVEMNETAAKAWLENTFPGVPVVPAKLAVQLSCSGVLLFSDPLPELNAANGGVSIVVAGSCVCLWSSPWVRTAVAQRTERMLKAKGYTIVEDTGKKGDRRTTLPLFTDDILAAIKDACPVGNVSVTVGKHSLCITEYREFSCEAPTGATADTPDNCAIASFLGITANPDPLADYVHVEAFAPTRCKTVEYPIGVAPARTTLYILESTANLALADNGSVGRKEWMLVDGGSSAAVRYVAAKAPVRTAEDLRTLRSDHFIRSGGFTEFLVSKEFVLHDSMVDADVEAFAMAQFGEEYRGCTLAYAIAKAREDGETRWTLTVGVLLTDTTLQCVVAKRLRASGYTISFTNQFVENKSIIRVYGPWMADVVDKIVTAVALADIDKETQELVWFSPEHAWGADIGYTDKTTGKASKSVFSIRASSKNLVLCGACKRVLSHDTEQCARFCEMCGAHNVKAQKPNRKRCPSDDPCVFYDPDAKFCYACGHGRK